MDHSTTIIETIHIALRTCRLVIVSKFVVSFIHRISLATHLANLNETTVCSYFEFFSTFSSKNNFYNRLRLAT